MEEQKNDSQIKKHTADCGCEICYRAKHNGRTKKIVITAAVLIVVFAAGVLVGRATNGGKNFGPRGMGGKNFPGGAMNGGNWQSGRTGTRNNSDIQMENKNTPPSAPQEEQTQAGATLSQTTGENTGAQSTGQPNVPAVTPVQNAQ